MGGKIILDEMPNISAVICTRDRAIKLERALSSLCSQLVPPEEILVVDNAPSDFSSKRLIQGKFPKVRYIFEAVEGLDFARNRALKESKSEIVAFLDDDAVADKEWIDNIRDIFIKHKHVGICTGRVESFSIETEAEDLFEKNGGFSRGKIKIHLPNDTVNKLKGIRVPLIVWAVSVGNGSSFAILRDQALKLGGFDEALDLGKVLPGGGDLDMFWRMLTSGFDLIYEPSVFAWHEHRRDLDGMFTQLAGHQRALVAFLKKSLIIARGKKRFSILLFLCWRLVKPGFRLVCRQIGKDPLPNRALLKIWWHAIQGFWAYSIAKDIARRRKESCISSTLLR